MPSPNKLQSPHTYAIANSAYRAMCEAKTSQSILISGESGAGTRYLVITPVASCATLASGAWGAASATLAPTLTLNLKP